jgi:cell fate regulator YaaT (PSP1 superfamily)
LAIIVKVQFHSAEKLYDFSAAGFDLKPGDKVIVETDRGRSMATVATNPSEVPDDLLPVALKSIQRKATPADLEASERNTARERETHHFCQAKIAERNLDMKLVKVEYAFDGSKAVFYFTADGRIDFRDLVKDLAQQFHTRIEMRQIGVRDEAKMVGGIGICGRELCCSSFLRDFAPVSVKMAKEQNLALNPTKISGQCGRLLCCLGYEYDTYCELRKGLPKCGKHVKCGAGEGDVIKVNTLGQYVTVRTADARELQLTADELKEGTTTEGRPAQKAPAEAPVAQKESRQKEQPAPEKQSEQPKTQKNEKSEKSGAGRRRNRNRNRHGGNKDKSDKPKETP